MAFTGIGRAIKDVTFSALTTASKTILGAINELNSKTDLEKIKILFKGSATDIGQYDLLDAPSNYDHLIVGWQFSPSGKSEECSILTVDPGSARYFNKMHYDGNNLFCSILKVTFWKTIFEINDSKRIVFNSSGGFSTQDYNQCYIFIIYGIKCK